METSGGISDRLRAFVDEARYERETILAFLRASASRLAPGSDVLDAGSGSAPYRELFEHCRYLTADFTEAYDHGWADSPPDIVCDLSSIPLPDETLDAVVCTQVLEHVPAPAAVLTEFRRMLRPGGRLYLTVPLLWEVHEAPYDFWRYTPYSLRMLCEGAGLRVEGLAPRGGRYRVLACWLDGSNRWTEPLRSRVWGRLVAKPVGLALRLVVAPLVARLDPLDRERTMTLGYECECVRPLSDG
jgi:SAM-dependent methyltransferase